jgi:hypothetical protein
VGVGHGAVKTAQLSTELAIADVVLIVAVDISEDMESTVVDGVGDGTDEDMGVEIASKLDKAEEAAEEEAAEEEAAEEEAAEEEAAEEEAAEEEVSKSTDDGIVDRALVESAVEVTERIMEEADEVVDAVDELGEEDGIMETLLVERTGVLAIDEIGPPIDDGDDECTDEDCAVEADPMIDGNVDEL